MIADSLHGRRALVTGGTRGIGAAVVSQLEALGAEVVFTGRHVRVDDDLAQYRAVDFAQRQDVERFASDVAREPWDVLVNCAGINRIFPFAEICIDDFDEVIDVNLRAPMVLCRAVIAGMQERGWGRIVNITSIFGLVSKEHRAPYSASKFGLDGLTAALAAEVAVHGVLANCVAPGVVDTDLTREVLGEAGIQEIVRTIPAGRLAEPEEIARVVAWLASPDNTYISGQTIVVDGGFTRV